MNRLTLMKMRKLRDFARCAPPHGLHQTDQTLGVEMPPSKSRSRRGGLLPCRNGGLCASARRAG